MSDPTCLVCKVSGQPMPGVIGLCLKCGSTLQEQGMQGLLRMLVQYERDRLRLEGMVAIAMDQLEAEIQADDGPSLDDPRRYARSDSCWTSLASAIKASGSSRRAVRHVRDAMVDGVPRIDGEIWQVCRAMGYLSSLSTIQHGRLALARARVLVQTGDTRQTNDGMPSRVWVWNSAATQEMVDAVDLPQESTDV